MGEGFTKPSFLSSKYAPSGHGFHKSRCSRLCSAARHTPRRTHFWGLKGCLAQGRAPSWAAHIRCLISAGDKGQAILTQVRTTLKGHPSSGLPTGTAKAVIGPLASQPDFSLCQSHFLLLPPRGLVPQALPSKHLHTERHRSLCFLGAQPAVVGSLQPSRLHFQRWC